MNMLHHFRLPAAIFLGSLCLTLIIIATGLDVILAHQAVLLKGDWAWFWRQHAAWPLIIVSTGALVFLIIPPCRRRWPALRHLAVVWLLTALLGGGLLNQVILQELADRPRPRDTILAQDAPPAGLSGHSFPSGHATLGFMFMTPYFVWRSSRRRWAYVFLAGGLLAGGFVGLARMALGAHYLTDLIWAGVIVALSAWFFDRYLPRRDVPTWLTLGILLVALLALVLGNRFKLNLAYQQPFEQVELPCRLTMIQPTDNTDTAPSVQIRLTGYGAPLSQLLLYADEGTVRLQRWRGLYHGLSCEGEVRLGRAGTFPAAKNP